METNNYPAYSYPDSNTSSPRSRDLDYDNPPQSSFDDQTFSKVKFMVSYGGKIKPRSHDNFLSYLGGDTKILSVDRNIKFTSFYSKLASVVSPDMTSFAFKYQLPGEDLDALISVTNDDDLELMMQEFDRVMRGSIKVSSARLRLFLFTDQQVTGSGDGRFGSANSETRILAGPVCEPVRDVKFAVASDASRVLAPTPIPPLPMPVPLPVQSTTADFLFGLDRMSVQVPGATSEQELVNQMNRLQISAQEVHQKLQLQNQQKQSAALYPPKNEDSFADPYQKSGYWQTVEQSNQPPQHQLQAQHHQQLQQLQQQQQIQQQQLQQQQQQQQQQKQQQQQQQQQQPVYLVHPAQQTNAYQAQSMIRPNQGGNYSVQQQQQPVYSTPAGAQIIMQGESAAYAKQKAYENSVSGRHVFYAPGQQAGVVAMSAAPSYPAMSAGPAVVVVSGADVRSGSGDGKIVHKITAASPATV